MKLSETLTKSLKEIETQAETAILAILNEKGFTSNGNPYNLEWGDRGSSLEDDNVPIIVTGAYADYSGLVIVYDLCSGCGDDETAIPDQLADKIYVLLNILGQLESK
jgi:hypothetical protein